MNDKDKEFDSDIWFSVYFARDAKNTAVPFNKGMIDDTKDWSEGIKHPKRKAIKIQWALNSDILFDPAEMKKFGDAIVGLFETGEFKSPFPILEGLMSLSTFIGLRRWLTIFESYMA